MTDDVPMALAGQHIAIIIPAYDGKVPVEMVTSLLGLTSLLSANGAASSLMSKSSNAIIHMARNELLAAVMKHPDITGVLHIDADIVFNPMDALRLIAFSDERYDVMAGLYRAKTDKHYLYFASWDADNAGFPVIGEDGTMECNRVPFGFCYVKRVVLDALWSGAKDIWSPDGEPLKLVFDCPYDEVEKKVIGEDYAFCDKAKALGFKIGALTDISLKHVGFKAYEGSFKSVFDQYKSGKISVSDTDYREL